MATATKTKVRKFAPYWENDDTANPVLVRYLEVDGDFYTVRLPDGQVRQVHLHTLGQFRSS